jgi:hypothetical protein
MSVFGSRSAILTFNFLAKRQRLWYKKERAARCLSTRTTLPKTQTLQEVQAMSDPQLNTIPDDVQERWLPVEGFPGYEVSDFGRVRSFWRSRGGHGGQVISATPQRILKGHLNRNGYRIVTLHSEERLHCLTVHRIVLEAFVGPRPPGGCCRHLDGIKTRNRLTNLAWGTYRENTLDKVTHGTVPNRKGMAHPLAKITDQMVIKIRELCAHGHLQKDVAQMFDVAKPTVSDIVRRKKWKHI